jgi:hypothetical protein
MGAARGEDFGILPAFEAGNAAQYLLLLPVHVAFAPDQRAGEGAELPLARGIADFPVKLHDILRLFEIVMKDDALRPREGNVPQVIAQKILLLKRKHMIDEREGEHRPPHRKLVSLDPVTRCHAPQTGEAGERFKKPARNGFAALSVVGEGGPPLCRIKRKKRSASVSACWPLCCSAPAQARLS